MVLQSKIGQELTTVVEMEVSDAAPQYIPTELASSNSFLGQGWPKTVVICDQGIHWLSHTPLDQTLSNSNSYRPIKT